RDPKGFYKKVREGKIPNFTGIDSIYEEPLYPDLVVETATESIEESTQKIIDLMSEKGLLKHLK
ncbi:MAG: adenylyl-sulfate kinase, partial [Candidatus Portiera sp.]|nr:adenylyl-sulfate kinase [Portiera sp.]